MDENQGLTTQQNANVATMADQQTIEAFRKRMEAFTVRLNRPPGKVLDNDTGEVFKYVPISFIENDLRKQFFGLVQFEIIESKLVINEIVCQARIKVFHPVLMQWLNYDGIGSGVLQMDAKDHLGNRTNLGEFLSYKKKNAAKLAAPIAYAEAIKNAAKKIGKRFGGDLNRKHEDIYSPNYKEDAEQPLNS